MNNIIKYKETRLSYQIWQFWSDDWLIDWFDVLTNLFYQKQVVISSCEHKKPSCTEYYIMIPFLVAHILYK